MRTVTWDSIKKFFKKVIVGTPPKRKVPTGLEKLKESLQSNLKVPNHSKYSNEYIELEVLYTNIVLYTEYLNRIGTALSSDKGYKGYIPTEKQVTSLRRFFIYENTYLDSEATCKLFLRSVNRFIAILETKRAHPSWVETGELDYLLLDLSSLVDNIHTE